MGLNAEWNASRAGWLNRPVAGRAQVALAFGYIAKQPQYCHDCVFDL